jgi:hypothetical protein
MSGRKWLIAVSVRPGAHQAGDADDLAGANVKLDACRNCRSRWFWWKTSSSSPRAACRRSSARVGDSGLHVAADHALDDAVLADVAAMDVERLDVPPSRMMVILSATRRISLSLWEMMIEVMPCLRNSMSRLSSASESVSLSEAVGSSRISSLHVLADSALAISTSCCLPTPISVDQVSGRLPEADLGEQLPRACEGRRPVDDTVLGHLVAEEDVLRDGEQRHQRQFLVDDDDTEMLAVARSSRSGASGRHR